MGIQIAKKCSHQHDIAIEKLVKRYLIDIIKQYNNELTWLILCKGKELSSNCRSSLELRKASMA